MRIQKRYLLSALTSSVFFIFIYAFLKVNIVIALLLTVVIYVGGILFFKKEDIREFSSEYINNYYYMASKCQNEANKTSNKEIINIVTDISNLTDMIITSLSQRPKKVEQVFSFFDYYLNILYKLLFKYNNSNDAKFKNNLINYLEKIKNVFEKQNKNMQEAKILDIENEIKIFEQTSGIDKEDIKVGEEDD